MLRQLGYKTFNGIIDESYDEIEDDVERLTMITNEIERLCNLNEEQLIEFKQQALEIVEYNYNLLMSKTNFLNQI
jgi:F0F1-type ATP synthase membrane subunit b/b'